jgi:hypothetical protein
LCGLLVLISEPLFKARSAEGMQTVDECKRLVEHFCAYEAHQFFLKVQEAGVRRFVCRRHDMEDSVASESHIDVLHRVISWMAPGWSGHQS